MQTYDILILNGPNLGSLGQRQPEIYGSLGMDTVPAMVQELLGDNASLVNLTFFQANGEGALIDRLELARKEGVAGVAFNAGAYTHTSLAIADCLAWIEIPTVEVHLSNVLARTEDPIRQHSYMGKSVIGMVAGFGVLSYALAVQALYLHLKTA
ncbi:MAG: 3-dehydroquinate dehydratase [Proteobacteria bacterium]|nr:3-dehydroquinate dehydratase [Pseudomonadota bacterium]MBU1612484.1 3-dehydroquinate dehydratase [Pseudomonadota bacterium]